MRAARFHEYGTPSVLRVEEVQQPPLQDDQVLIRVYASSINNADIGSRRGMLRLVHTRHLPHIPGYDVAGEVAGCGPAVTAFVPGDRVAAMLGLTAGGQAEYAPVKQHSVARLSEETTYAHAAAIPLAGLTALQGLRKHARIRSGQRVLINGAAGGVGSFAVQLAKLIGCHVTGVCRKEKSGFVMGLGADETVDYAREDFATRRQSWEVIFDAGGGRDFADVRHVLTPDGVMVAATGSPKSLLVAARSAIGRGPRYKMFITRASGHDLTFLAHLLAQGKLRPAVDRLFPLEQIQSAHHYFESEKLCGKVIVEI